MSHFTTLEFHWESGLTSYLQFVDPQRKVAGEAERQMLCPPWPSFADLFRNTDIILPRGIENTVAISE